MKTHSFRRHSAALASALEAVRRRHEEDVIDEDVVRSSSISMPVKPITDPETSPISSKSKLCDLHLHLATLHARVRAFSGENRSRRAPRRIKAANEHSSVEDIELPGPYFTLYLLMNTAGTSHTTIMEGLRSPVLVAESAEETLEEGALPDAQRYLRFMRRSAE